MKLTQRQRQIVTRLAEGLTCSQIAAELEISEAGVRKHAEAIAKRLTGPGGPVRRILRHASELLAA